MAKKVHAVKIARPLESQTDVVKTLHPFNFCPDDFHTKFAILPATNLPFHKSRFPVMLISTFHSPPLRPSSITPQLQAFPHSGAGGSLIYSWSCELELESGVFLRFLSSATIINYAAITSRSSLIFYLSRLSVLEH